MAKPQGVSRLLQPLGQLHQPGSQGQHGLEGLVAGKLLGGPGPGVSHGHRALAAPPTTGAGFHLYGHVQQHAVVHHASAELDGRAVGYFLGSTGNFQDADVRRFAHRLAFVAKAQGFDCGRPVAAGRRLPGCFNPTEAAPQGQPPGRKTLSRGFSGPRKEFPGGGLAGGFARAETR